MNDNIFSILLFCLITILVYFLSALLTYPFRKLIRNKNIKRGVLIFISTIITYFFLFTSSAKNYKKAFIKPINNQFIVTVKGKRVLMAHDLFSLLFNKTYEDSMIYIIPRNKGLIKGQELPQRKGYYNPEGSITIQGNQLKVDLLYNNYDQNIIEAGSWNGSYELTQQVP